MYLTVNMVVKKLYFVLQILHDVRLGRTYLL
jgi:hypothetical protein